jgi:hypothetical protein
MSKKRKTMKNSKKRRKTHEYSNFLSDHGKNDESDDECDFFDF